MISLFTLQYLSQENLKPLMKLFLHQKQLSGNKQCKVSTHQLSKIKPGNSVIYLRVSQLLEADGYSRRRLCLMEELVTRPDW